MNPFLARSGLVLLAAALPLAPAGAQGTLPSIESAVDATSDGRIFIETMVERTEPFEGELVRIVLRVAVDANLLETEAVQLFAQPLDLPLQIDASWWEGTSALSVVAHAARGNGVPRPLVRCAVGSRIVEARRMDDRAGERGTFRVFELERAFVAEHAGRFELEAPLVRFAYATRFRDDLIGGRLPENRVDAFVRGSALELRVQQVPSAGRPIEAAGAVGRFEISATTAVESVEVGEPFELEVVITGTGALERFPAPRPEPLDGFRIQKTTDRVEEGRRIVVHELAALDTRATAVPPVALGFFDPLPVGEYRVIKSRALPLHVVPARGPEDPVVAPTRPVATAEEIAAAPVAPGPMPPGAGFAAAGSVITILAVLALLALAVLGLGVSLVLRRRRLAERDPVRARAREAAFAFEARVAVEGSDVGDAFAEYLAARLACEKPAVIAPDLEARLANAGIDTGLAARAHRFLDAHVAARYGAGAPPQGLADAQRLVEELERAFEASERR